LVVAPRHDRKQLSALQTRNRIIAMAGFIYRENRVPHYQRLYQKNDGIRLWVKHPRSRMLIYPYLAMLGVGITGTLYGMCRLVAGKKSFY